VYSGATEQRQGQTERVAAASEKAAEHIEVEAFAQKRVGAASVRRALGEQGAAEEAARLVDGEPVRAPLVFRALLRAARR
jgi:hypothetical protein